MCHAVKAVGFAARASRSPHQDPIRPIQLGRFYNPDSSYHGNSNVTDSYFLSENIRQFDAQFFGIKPVRGNAIDPQQRLLLETVYESIEAAGLTINGL